MREQKEDVRNGGTLCCSGRYIKSITDGFLQHHHGVKFGQVAEKLRRSGKELGRIIAKIVVEEENVILDSERLNEDDG